jgi:PAT family acetyl-CoA transporter-like MFS transporter 1
VAIFKHERDEFAREQLEEHPDYGIKRAYPILLQLFKFKPVMLLGAMIFSMEGAFAAWENITSLKLIDYGIPKENIAFFSIPSAPVQILLPLFITRFTTGPKPLSFYYKMFPCRLISMAITAIFVYFTPTMIDKAHTIPALFYLILTMVFMMEQVNFTEFNSLKNFRYF